MNANTAPTGLLSPSALEDAQARYRFATRTLIAALVVSEAVNIFVEGWLKPHEPQARSLAVAVAIVAVGFAAIGTAAVMNNPDAPWPQKALGAALVGIVAVYSYLHFAYLLAAAGIDDWLRWPMAAIVDLSAILFELQRRQAHKAIGAHRDAVAAAEQPKKAKKPKAAPKEADHSPTAPAELKAVPTVKATKAEQIQAFLEDNPQPETASAAEICRAMGWEATEANRKAVSRARAA